MRRIRHWSGFPIASAESRLHIPRPRLYSSLPPQKNLQKTTNFILPKVFSRDWKSVRAVVVFLAWPTHLFHAPAKWFSVLPASHPHLPPPSGSCPFSRDKNTSEIALPFRVSC